MSERKSNALFPFPPDYRCICFFSCDSLSKERSTRIQKLLQPILGGQPELGICLGKYDFVVEFSSDSVMVASYKIKEFQRRIRRDFGLRTSASLYLCKELYKARYAKKRQPLHSYTFLRPSRLRYPSTKLPEVVEVASKVTGSGSVFWNSTSYSAIVKLDSEDAKNLIEGLIQMRHGIGDLISESSTFFALTLGARGLSHDVESKGNFPCIIHAKVKDLNIDFWQSKKTVLGNSHITLGWFDLTFQKDFKSVNSAVQSVLAFRDQFREVIETETVVVQPRKEKD